MYYSLIGLLAILILFIVNRDILHDPRDSYDKDAWRVYRRFLLAVLVYYISDTLWGILESRGLSTLLFADTTAYFAAMAVGILYWAEFTVAYLDEDRPFGRALVIAGRILAGLVAALTVVNIFVPVLFTVEKGGVYNALPLRYVSLSCQILLLLLIALHSFASMLRLGAGSEKQHKYEVLISFGLIMAFFLFAQLWFPLLPMYSIAYMLGTTLLHSFVANEEKEGHQLALEDAKRIKALQENISALLNNIPALTFTKDAATGVYLACNQAFAEYAHKDSPDGVVGLTDAQIFDAETAAHFVKDDKIALSISAPYVFYEEVADAAGSQRQFQTTKLKYKDPYGRLCVLGMCQDVTDMVRIQHENVMTKEAYESAVSSSQMYTHIAKTLTRDYTDMFYVNCDSEEFIEYRRSENGGALLETRRGLHFFSDCREELADGVHADDRAAFLDATKRRTLMDALERKDIFVMTYRHLIDGKSTYVRMKISRLEDDEHFIIIRFTDVDAEMRDAMAKSDALADALAAAEEASKTKSAFLSNMSHELRSPMNAIIGLNTLALKRDDLDDATRDYLEKTGASAKQLLALINDILDMSRMESGRSALRAEPFSFRAMLDQINDATRDQCSAKALTYEFRIDGEPDEEYIGDEEKLKKALTHILSNAVKYTDAPGSVTLSVEQTAKTDGFATFHFRVKDTGIGMDEEFLPMLFEPFAQKDGGHKAKYGSTGLGMAITKRIVEMMSGTITVKSQKGVGTEFDVTLTLSRGEVQENREKQTVDLKSLTLLLVDDNPIDLAHAKLVLEEAGIRTDTAASGQDALRMMERQHDMHKPYSLVLMDWQMPGMNGLETSAEIRRQFKDESTVVVMTAYNWEDIQADAQRVGVNSFLSKPLSSSRLIDELERIVRRSGIAPVVERKRASLAGRRILLAEDMALNAEITADTLAFEGIAVDHAENGKIAVDMFAASEPGFYSAILMDMRMPVMDGLKATSEIRALDRPDAKRIPIIALTANAFDEDARLSLQAGMNAHLSKPTEPERLYQVLGELIYEAGEA